MKIQHRFAFVLAWCGLALCLGASPSWAQNRPAAANDPLANANRLPATLEQVIGKFRANLPNGFAVARGYWTLWGIDDCKYPLQTLGYCYGNNPVAPYALAVVPPWSDEYVDQRFHHIINEPHRNMIPSYRLSGREALVVVAQLPPKARYFGIGTNVFTREASLNTSDPIYKTVTDPLLLDILFGVSPDPSRMMLVSSIGNSTNDVVIENQANEPDPWGKSAYFVITSDSGLAAQMKNALVSAGADPLYIFTEPVAPALVRLGLDHSADDLITYIRYSMPEDEAAGDEWRRALPVTVLRVRDMSSQPYTNPFPIPVYSQRSWTFDENQLDSDFTALQTAVIAKWGQQKQATILSFFSAYKDLDLIGQHCLGYGYPNPDVTRGPMDCLGDTQDADYQISQSVQIDQDQVIAAVGVLSTETRNATYTSLSVNWFPELVGIKNIDDVDLKGTAESFADASHDYSQFYVYYLARDCTGLSPCVEISKQMVPTGGIIKLIQRNYLKPGSTSGPDPDYIVNPVTIVLDGRNRPTM